jgi:hypothetical protein
MSVFSSITRGADGAVAASSIVCPGGEWFAGAFISAGNGFSLGVLGRYGLVGLVSGKRGDTSSGSACKEYNKGTRSGTDDEDEAS